MYVPICTLPFLDSWVLLVVLLDFLLYLYLFDPLLTFFKSLQLRLLDLDSLDCAWKKVSLLCWLCCLLAVVCCCLLSTFVCIIRLTFFSLPSQQRPNNSWSLLLLTLHTAVQLLGIKGFSLEFQLYKPLGSSLPTNSRFGGKCHDWWHVIEPLFFTLFSLTTLSFWLRIKSTRRNLMIDWCQGTKFMEYNTEFELLTFWRWHQCHFSLLYCTNQHSFEFNPRYKICLKSCVIDEEPYWFAGDCFFLNLKCMNTTIPLSCINEIKYKWMSFGTTWHP